MILIFVAIESNVQQTHPFNNALPTLTTTMYIKSTPLQLLYCPTTGHAIFFRLLSQPLNLTITIRHCINDINTNITSDLSDQLLLYQRVTRYWWLLMSIPHAPTSDAMKEAIGIVIV